MDINKRHFPFSSNNYKIAIINFMILLFLFRSSIPAFKYPFMFLYFYSSINYIFFTRSHLKNIKTFLLDFFIVIVLIGYYIISIFISDKFYIEIFKDTLNILVLVSFFIILIETINSDDDFTFFLSNLVKFIIWFSAVISIYSIYEFFSIFYRQEISARPAVLSLLDYNFALLPVFFGFVSILIRLRNNRSKTKIVFLNILLLVLAFHVFISGSRRGFIIINIIIVLLLIVYLVSFFIKDNYIKNWIKNVKYFLFISATLLVLIIYFVYGTSYSIDYKVLNKLGIKRVYSFQQEITGRCYRYLTIFNKTTTYTEFYNKVWTPIFDSRDPDTGWGVGFHKTVYPLTGENVEIVPPYCKGFLLDRTCFQNTWGGNAYSYTNAFLYNSNLEKRDSIQTSVFCYVSEDFNGDWVLIALTNNSPKWIGSYQYDMKRKGTWQKLSINKYCEPGTISQYLYFCKYGVTDFKELTGYVIFACPEWSIVRQKGATLNSNHGIINTHRHFDTIKTIDKAKMMKPNESTLTFLMFPFNSILSKYSDVQIKDPFQKLILKFLSFDSTYYEYKSTIVLDTISNSFSDLRIIRWKFAWQIFVNEYNVRQKIFGNGFVFLNWYGYYFLGDKTQTDYPHNPFLYILLYSGILGLLIYIYFMYKVFYLYLKYIKKIFLFFIFFSITFFFTFFSGGSPFDPPIMGFFVILPFFIHSVHKRDKLQNHATNLE